MSRKTDAQHLEALSDGALRIVDVQSGWPAIGSVDLDGVPVPVTLWVGPVGRSHRGRDDVERRFQNPGSNRPIWVDGTTVPLLLGLWETDEFVRVARPVVVSADPVRRSGRKTRFSIFVGLDALLDGAALGWREGANSDGEWLCCLTPTEIPRLVRGLLGDMAPTGGGEAVTLLGPAAAGSAAASETEEIARLARIGLTLQEIGSQVGLTRERVRQILGRWPDLAAFRKQRARERARKLTAQGQTDRWLRLRAEFAASGVDPDEVLEHLRKSRHLEQTARKFDLVPGEVSALYSASPFSFPLVAGTSRIPRRHSDEKIIEYLRTAAHVLGVARLTASSYNDFAARQSITPDVWPSSQTVAKRFGGWNAACEAAGLEVVEHRRTYTQDFPAARCRAFVDAYVRAALATDVRPTFAGYQAWAPSVGGPSGPTVRNRLGAWSEVLAASLARVE